MIQKVQNVCPQQYSYSETKGPDKFLTCTVSSQQTRQETLRRYLEPENGRVIILTELIPLSYISLTINYKFTSDTTIFIFNNIWYIYIYSVIKKSLCTWRLYCNHQVHRHFLIVLYICIYTYLLFVYLFTYLCIYLYIGHVLAIFRQSYKTSQTPQFGFTFNI